MFDYHKKSVGDKVR